MVYGKSVKKEAFLTETFGKMKNIGDFCPTITKTTSKNETKHHPPTSSIAQHRCLAPTPIHPMPHIARQGTESLPSSLGIHTRRGAIRV